jgi:N-acetylglucosamine repressor
MKRNSTKKERDKAVIMSLVRRFGSLSRVAVQGMTKARPSTISMLVRELIEEGKLKEAGTSNNPLGRKQILLKVNEDYGFVLGVEFDPDVVVAAAMNLTPSILAMSREPTYLEGGVAGLTRQLLACTRQVVEEAGLSGAAPLGIAFADAGLIDSRRGVSVNAADIDFWKEVPLRDLFEEEFEAPFLLESNTRCRATAERMLGVGDFADDMLYVDYRAGIGVGIFSEGRMLRGASESAGELGHTHIMENGPPCKCGSFGCLEAIAGGAALGAKARRALMEGSTSIALSLAGGDIQKVTGWIVIEAARQGDKMCSSLVEQMGNYLGLGLANLVNLYNPSVVILGPRLFPAGDGLLAQITRIVRRQALPHATRDLVIRFGELGDEAGVLGAGLLVLEQLFAIPDLNPMVEPSGFILEAGPSKPKGTRNVPVS